MKKDIWHTIKYKSDMFDVKWSSTDQQIKEIRSIDSAIDIASLLSLEVKKEFHEIIVNKGTHHAL